MKKNFARFSFGIFTVVTPIYLFYTLLMYEGYKPLLSYSVSFDAKVRCFDSRKVRRSDLLAIGSSMTLYNLSSKVIMDSVSSSYFNLASWGLQIGDTKKILVNYLLNYRPKCIIICSSALDFTAAGNGYGIDQYLNTFDLIKEYQEQYFYMKNYNSLGPIIKRKEMYDEYKNDSNGYNSLKFDIGGGALINLPRDKISKLRWNQLNLFPTKYTEFQYREFASLCLFLSENHIPLIFIQSPNKRSYTNTSKSLSIIKEHCLKCKSIVEKFGGIYSDVHYDKRFLNDSMFIDQFHLSQCGATLLTQDILPDLRKAIIRNTHLKLNQKN